VKVCFVGAFNEKFEAGNIADSPAANQVQFEIIKELTKFYNQKPFSVISFKPKKHWPHQPFFIATGTKKNGLSIGYINIPILKTIIFSLRLLLYLNEQKFDLVFKYNVCLAEAIILKIYKLLNKKAFICIIIQDIKYPQKGLRYLHGISEYLAIKICTAFDFIIPITHSIIEDFNLPKSKSLVFNGGITRQTKAIIKKTIQLNPPKNNFAVFAGELERYNGIDLLINEWIKSIIPIELHIFGKGSLSNQISAATASCKFIIYHGFVSESEVNKWQISASFNICLRYPIGINSNYFFPSKLFNLIAAKGTVISNDFNNFPVSLKPFCSIVDQDLKNLCTILKNNSHPSELNYKERLNWLYSNCQWSTVISECENRRNANKKTN